jgi:hypothetical protein
MSDNDLIRRGIALAVLRDEIDLARIAMPQCVPILAADMRAIAALPAVEPLTDPRVKALVEALRKWDDLIKHQYSGSREAMSDMTRAAQHTAALLAEIEGEKR